MLFPRRKKFHPQKSNPTPPELRPAVSAVFFDAALDGLSRETVIHHLQFAEASDVEMRIVLGSARNAKGGTMIATTDPVAIAAADLARARIEQRLLACVCPLGRRGLALAREADITHADFRADDTHAIFSALEAAEMRGLIHDPEKTIRLAVKALQLVGAWDPADERTFVSGSRYGPAALAALFARTLKEDAERRLLILARQMKGTNE